MLSSLSDSPLVRVLLRALWCVALVLVPLTAPGLADSAPQVSWMAASLSGFLVLCVLLSHPLPGVVLLASVQCFYLFDLRGHLPVIVAYAVPMLVVLGMAAGDRLLCEQARMVLQRSGLLRWFRPLLFFSGVLAALPLYFDIALPWPSILFVPWCLLLWASLPRTRSLWSELLHGLLLFLLSTSVFLFTAEVGARVLFRPPNSGTILRPHPERLFELSPGSSHTFMLPDFVAPPFRSPISSQGLRDKAYGPKAAGAQRILTLGDSMVFGWGVPGEETLPMHLQRQLQGRYPKAEIEVLNAATPGYGPWQSLSWLRERGADFQPDIVLYVLNLANDHANELYRAGKQLRCYSVEWQQVLRRYERANSALGRVDQWLRRHARLYQVWGHATGELEYPLLQAAQWLRVYAPQATLPPEAGLTEMELHRAAWYPELLESVDLVAQSVSEMRDWCEERGMEFVVALLPTQAAVCEPAYKSLQWQCPWETVPYNEVKDSRVFEEALMAQGVECIAAQGWFRAQPSPCDLYIPFDGHLTPEGNRVAAEVAAVLIRPRLGARLSGTGRPPPATP